MTTITRQQALWRWDRLPSKLREALTSEVSSDFVSSVCGDQHLPEDKIKLVSKLAAYVVSGFLHPEDLAREIKNQGGVPEQVAAAVADGLNKRIFAPIRSDIDKAFNPKPDDGPLPEDEEEKEIGPKIFDEIRPLQPQSTANASIPAPRPTQKTQTPTASQPGWSFEEIRPLQPQDTTKPPQPKTGTVNSASGFIEKAPAFQPGWSRPSPIPNGAGSQTKTPQPTTSAAPKPQIPSLLRKSDGQAPPPAPRAAPPSIPIGELKAPSWAAQQPPAPSPFGKSDGSIVPSPIKKDEGLKEVPLTFSKISFQAPSPLGKNGGRGETPPTTETKPQPMPAPQAQRPASMQALPPLNPSEPLPTIIHEEPKNVSPRPASFSFPSRSPNFSDTTSPTKNIPPRPAVLEFGGRDNAPTPPPAPKPIPPTTPKVVHYSEMTTPAPKSAVPQPPLPPLSQK